MAPTEKTGVLPVDKPAGPTSHDVVMATRRALRTRRVGHTGTLDPFASGLMLLCVGAATRIAQYLTGLPKTYRAVIRFGAATDTDDRTGQPVAVSDSWRSLNAPLIREALETFTGDLMQLPPVFSAKKVGGVAMHRLARRGSAPAPKPSPVRIDRIELIDLDLPDATIEIDCSAGTYVRSVARDAGTALGTCAHLAELRRTRIGRHHVDDAVPAARLDDAEAVRRAWLNPIEALDHLPRLDVVADEAAMLRRGIAIPAPQAAPREGTVALALGEQLVAIAHAADGLLHPRKVFPSE
jgi:tRNA pseudouridine55 synthase